MLPINELLQEGRYLITRQIGQNDIGVIYEGIDNIYKRKIIINQCAYSGNKSLSGEEKILKRIKHETFLQVTDCFAEPNNWFVIMEAEDGEFLSEIFKKEKNNYQLLDVINWTEQLLDGLSYIHLNMPAIIYGDLRAQNIFLTSDGKMKLLASAILKNRVSIPNFEKSSSSALNYAPLEQIWNSLDSASQKVIAESYDETAEKILIQPLDARSDIFSLGVLIYRLLSGEFPKNALERSIEILEGNPDPLMSSSEINAEVPAEISDIIMKTLEIGREHRLDSAVMMRQMLRTAFVRIRDRETVKTELNMPTDIFVLEDSYFALSEIAAPEKNKSAEPIRDVANEKIVEVEEIAEKEEITASRKFENFSLDLPPVMHIQPEESLDDLFADELPAELPSEIRAIQAETEESIAESEQLPAKPILEIETEHKFEIASAEFFDFDKDDEKLLGVGESTEVIGEIKPSIKSLEENTEVLDVQTTEKVIPEVTKTDFAKEYSPDEFSILFENAEKKNSSKWTIPVVAIILVLVGGGILGAWMFISKSNSNAASQTVQTISNQAEVNPPNNTASESSAENLTLSNSQSQNSSSLEVTPPTLESNTETNPVLTQEIAPTAKKTTALKPKPNVSRPQTASAKTPEKEKKKVTVDDLISDY